MIRGLPVLGLSALLAVAACRGGEEAPRPVEPARPSTSPADARRPQGLPSGVVVVAALDRAALPYASWWVDFARPDAPARVALAPGILAYDGSDLRHVALPTAVPEGEPPGEDVVVSDVRTGRRSVLVRAGAGTASDPRASVFSVVGSAVSLEFGGRDETPGGEVRESRRFGTWLDGKPASLADLVPGPEAASLVARARDALDPGGAGPAAGSSTCGSFDPDSFALRPRRNDLEVVFTPARSGAPPCPDKALEVAFPLPKSLSPLLGTLSFRLPGPPPPPAAEAADFHFHVGPDAGFLLRLRDGALDLAGPDRDTRRLASGVARIVSVQWVKGEPPRDLAPHVEARFSPLGDLRATVGPEVVVDGFATEWDQGQPFPVETAGHLIAGRDAWSGPADLSFFVKARVAGGRLGLFARVRDEDARLAGPGPRERVAVWFRSGADLTGLELDPREGRPAAITRAWPPGGEGAHGQAVRDARASFREVEDGWLLEFSIPLSALGDTDGRVPLGLAVTDADGSGTPGATLATSPVIPGEVATLGELRLPGS
ncbi:hypothetical protein L6R50_00245 [Myxococcota bacterium]|nr:hypothetical protein [Myxococcota bacterium]